MHKRVRRTAVFVKENVRGCHGEKWVKHYSSDHRILLVGEGDFSFSLSLAVSFGSGSNIVATSCDKLGILIKKYKKVESNLETLKNLGASVLHGVDATQMQRHESLRMHKFDRIVFNFPHAGFHGKEDNPQMIEKHRKLLRGFFSNAILMLETHGEVHVTHKTAHPYCLWHIEELASSNSLILIDSVHFVINDYPGYSNKRGHGANSDDPFPLGECRTFKFMMSRGSRPHIYSYSRETDSRETEGVSNVYKHAALKYGTEVNNVGGPIQQIQMETEGVSNVCKYAALKYGSEVDNLGGPIQQIQMQNSERCKTGKDPFKKHEALDNLRGRLIPLLFFCWYFWFLFFSGAV